DTSASIGSRGDARGGTFFGTIDEPSVYSRALSTAEIQAIYNAGSAGKCPPPPPTNCVPAPSGLVSWWRAEGTAVDAVDGNHGLTQGGLAFASGQAGAAFSFNGTNAAVIITASSNLNVGSGSGFSIET